MVGLQLTTPDAKAVHKYLMEAGIVANATSDSVLRFVPPLVVTTADCDRSSRRLSRRSARSKTRAARKCHCGWPVRRTRQMWQRFTERARRVVFFAQEEAGRLGENYVSTEHLLLGLVRENDSVAARILDRMGVSLGRIRSEIERQVARGDGRMGQDMQLTPRAKRVIDLAYDEARQLSNNYIGTEHLLLGLIREGEGLAGRVLAKLGVELERTREEVRRLQDNDSSCVKPRRWTGVCHAPEPRSLQWRAGSKGYDIQTDATKWRGRSLVSLFDVSPEQVMAVLDVAARLKALKRQDKFVYFSHPKTLALLFEKPSLRTRVSFEAGMAHLAGHAIYLAPADVGLGVRESVADVAGGLSRWVDAIAARTSSTRPSRSWPPARPFRSSMR